MIEKMTKMNKNDILNALQGLDLNKEDYIIICGASLVLQDIIETTNDIDLACTNLVFDSISWDFDDTLNDVLKVNGLFSISPTFYDSDKIVIIDGYKCMNIEKCYDVKKLLNRPKDKKIIEKLDLLLAKNDNLRYEKALYEKGISLIAGVDEVGRGPLVGPVVTAAVILPKGYKLKGLTDSKKLSEKSLIFPVPFTTNLTSDNLYKIFSLLFAQER